MCRPTNPRMAPTAVAAAALLVYGLGLAALVWAFRRDAFKDRRHGLRVSLSLSMGWLCAGGILVVGVWGYETARVKLHRQIVSELESVGRIVEQQLDGEVSAAARALDRVAKEIGAVGGKPTARQLDSLRHAQELHPYLLQVRLTGAKGDVLFENSVSGKLDPRSRVAHAVSMDGKTYVSNPFRSPAFDKYVLNVSVPLPGKEAGTLGTRYDLERELQELTRAARFNQSGYAVILGDDGRVISHPDHTRVHDDLSAYPAFVAAREGRSGSLVAVNKAGRPRLFFYRPLKSPATVDATPLVLLTEIDQDEVTRSIRVLRLEFLLAAFLVAVLCLLFARLLSSQLEKPLLDLGDVARRVEGGDLEAKASRVAADEVGRLASAINGMVQGLQERERQRAVFGQYVARQVSDKLLKGQVELGGEHRRVSILFSDIRNFTTMSEKLPAGDVVRFLNEYFSEMVDAVFEHDGMLDKFIGDGIMALFGAFETETGPAAEKKNAIQAVRAALKMQALLAKINGERATRGEPAIAIGVGVHTDDVVLGNIGSHKRLQYTAIGDGVNTAARVESLNKELGTTILITETTHALVSDAFECRPVRDAALKGKSTAIKFFEVVSARAASAPAA
jgi:class 3 adenylate cyclase